MLDSVLVGIILWLLVVCWLTIVQSDDCTFFREGASRGPGLRVSPTRWASILLVCCSVHSHPSRCSVCSVRAQVVTPWQKGSTAVLCQAEGRQSAGTSLVNVKKWLRRLAISPHSLSIGCFDVELDKSATCALCVLYCL